MTTERVNTYITSYPGRITPRCTPFARQCHSIRTWISNPLCHHRSLNALHSLFLSQFVYPFSLENHVLTLESSRRKTFAAHEARREAQLKARLEEKERRKRDALRRIAPGFEPRSIPLVPTRMASTGSPIDDGSLPSTPPIGTVSHVQPRSAMDDLVDQLAALDSARD